MLGIISNKLPGLLGGSDDKAISYFKSAMSAAPDEPLNPMFLGKLYTKKGMKEDLTKLLEQWSQRKVLEIPSERYESQGALAEIQFFMTNHKWPE
jgi:hypothetical protein